MAIKEKFSPWRTSFFHHQHQNHFNLETTLISRQPQNLPATSLGDKSSNCHRFLLSTDHTQTIPINIKTCVSQYLNLQVSHHYFLAFSNAPAGPIHQKRERKSLNISSQHELISKCLSRWSSEWFFCATTA